MDRIFFIRVLPHEERIATNALKARQAPTSPRRQSTYLLNLRYLPYQNRNSRHTRTQRGHQLLDIAGVTNSSSREREKWHICERLRCEYLERSLSQAKLSSKSPKKPCFPSSNSAIIGFGRTLSQMPLAPGLSSGLARARVAEAI